MPISNWRLSPYRLPLQREWRSSQVTFQERSGWLICLEDSSGLIGYGDCAPLPQAGTEPLEFAGEWLKGILPSLHRKDATAALQELPPPQQAPPAARCGLETALLDLEAQQAGVSIASLLSADSTNQVSVNACIGTLNSDALHRARAAIDKGFRMLMVKVGVALVEEELTQLHHLARGLPPNCRLRLDANLAWSDESAIRFIEGIAGLPIESLEEPLQSPNLKLLAELQQQCECSLALDESLDNLALDRIMREKPVRRLILKPMVRGGLRPSLDIARQARDAGLEIVVTTTIDSAVGVWATAQLAAALNSEGSALTHGLATADWLANDLGDSPPIENGVIHLPANPGLGFLPYSQPH